MRPKLDRALSQLPIQLLNVPLESRASDFQGKFAQPEIEKVSIGELVQVNRHEFILQSGLPHRWGE